MPPASGKTSPWPPDRSLINACDENWLRDLLAAHPNLLPMDSAKVTAWALKSSVN
jgi:hypothetical protein